MVPAQAVGTETPQFWGFSLSGPRGWRRRGAGAGGTQWAMSNRCLGFACAFGCCKWGARGECFPGDTNAALSSRSVRCCQAASQAKSCRRVVTSPEEPVVDEGSCYSGEGGGPHAQLAQWGILMGDRGPHSESCQRQRTPDTGPDEKEDRVPASSDAGEGGRWPQQVAREPPGLCQQPWDEGVECAVSGRAASRPALRKVLQGTYSSIVIPFLLKLAKVDPLVCN